MMVANGMMVQRKIVEEDMKIKIDQRSCQGHARCNAVAGDLYKLNDQGYIASEGFDVPPGMESLARRGARACPERAISALEDIAQSE
jgi:ferredoxin